MSILREVTVEAKEQLNKPDILLFIGARQVGKTTILKQLQSYLEEQQEKTYFINLEDPDYLQLLNQSPKNLLTIFPFDLKKQTFVFIDEVQYLKNPSNFLKFFYDEYGGRIKLIVSGSSAFYLDRKFKDSLAGRKKIFYVRTLSFREFLRFHNENDLAERICHGVSLAETEKLQQYFGEYLVYGGYPRVVLAPLGEKQELLQEIAYSYIKKDIYEAHIKQEDVFYKLFKALAAGIGGLVNAAELAATFHVSKTAIDHYLYVMQKSFHLRLIRPFFKNVRKELTKMPKVYFYDTGLRNFFANNFNTFAAREDKGALLENGAFRQLIESHGEDGIKFWRTTAQNEVDFVVNDEAAFEVKASPPRFKKNKYKSFIESYPQIPLVIVSFRSPIKAVGTYPVKNVWEI